MQTLMRTLRHTVHRYRHPQRFRYLETVLETQRLSASALQDKQQRDLSALIEHVARHVPFYRQRWQGIDRTLVAQGTLEGLPILRKQDVIAQRDTLVADDVDRRTLRVGHTGGSTGTPLAYYYDTLKHELMRAGMCRSYMWSGWRPGERILNFWGARRDLKADSFGQRLDAWFAAEQTLAAYDYSEADLAAWVARIQHYRPVLLQGYASVLAELARYVIACGAHLPATLKGVYSTAELLHESQRAQMQTAFGCPVFNQYGSREIPNIACECRAGSLHILTDMVYLESVVEAGVEKLLVTSLTNRHMPFIRYDIGDSGRLKSGLCDCGLPFPLLEMELCRSNDLIRTPAGRMIYPAYFIHLLDGLNGIRHYRFVQTGLDRIELSLVADVPLAVDAEAGLQQRVRQDLGDGMRLDIHYVNRIARTAAGKHRFVVSQLDEAVLPES